MWSLFPFPVLICTMRGPSVCVCAFCVYVVRMLIALHTHAFNVRPMGPCISEFMCISGVFVLPRGAIGHQLSSHLIQSDHHRELSRGCDTVDHGGMADTKHSGHGKKIEVVKRRVFPLRASAPLGKVPWRAHALMWLHDRVSELAHLASKCQKGEVWPRASVMQWQRIMGKIADTKGLSQTVRRIITRWSANIDLILEHTPVRDAAVLKGIAAAAIFDAAEWKQHTTSNVAASWAECVNRQLKNDAGFAHRLVKRDQLQPCDFTTIGAGPNITAKPSDILHEDC